MLKYVRTRRTGAYKLFILFTHERKNTPRPGKKRPIQGLEYDIFKNDT